VLNIVIVIIFWCFFGKATFAGLSWHGYDLFLRILIAVHHIFPILTSFANLYVSKQYFLKSFWRVLFVTGLVYIFANYLGTMVTGKPVYPVLDWKNKKLTFIVYFLQCPILAALQYYVAKYTQEHFKP
jgi:hypothetical protein